MSRRRTKIVCTLGPASSDPGTIRELVDAGMDVARLNFSHGDHETHRRLAERVRAAAREANREVAILQDLAGPKIRLGELPAAGVTLAAGDEVVLVGADDARRGALPVSYRRLADDVADGDPILLADGLLELEVTEVAGGEVRCRVVTGGTVTSHKGVNLPGTRLRVPSVTDKDRADLELGLELGVDLVALSFVRHEDDLAPVRARLDEQERPPLLIAKIEKPQAVERFAQILEHVDGVMVARGDLGVEMPVEQIPWIQKQLIGEARRAGRPVITATQMLRSMVDSPRPTRAEATDVANAVLDGTDAVMLSEESAVGRYPAAAVATLDRLARATEPHLEHERLLAEPPAARVPATAGAITRAACQLARDVDAAAIVAATTSGSTARLVARLRPPVPVVALTTSPATAAQLALSFGVVPGHVPALQQADRIFEVAVSWCREHGLAAAGDRIVVTAGLPLQVPGTTDLVRVLEL